MTMVTNIVLVGGPVDRTIVRQNCHDHNHIMMAMNTAAGQLTTCLLQCRESVMIESDCAYYTYEYDLRFFLQISTWSWPTYYTQAYIVNEILL